MFHIKESTYLDNVALKKACSAMVIIGDYQTIDKHDILEPTYHHVKTPFVLTNKPTNSKASELTKC